MPEIFSCEMREHLFPQQSYQSFNTDIDRRDLYDRKAPLGEKGVKALLGERVQLESDSNFLYTQLLLNL